MTGKNNEIGSALKKWRKKNKLTQREAAKVLKIPLGTLKNYEQGLSHPPDYATEMLLDVLK